MAYPSALKKLIEVFCRFPGIGPKTAQRLAFYLLGCSREEVIGIARAMVEAKDKLTFCSDCGSLAESDHCSYCGDAQRDQTILCVVQEPRDVLVLERTGQYTGGYHVLHGALSPLDGIGPEELKLDHLVRRIEKCSIEEVIIATNPNVEGDATATYLARLLKPLSVRVTRIAFGLPVGGDLEYADDLTLERALDGRREM
ncbi:MAG TPA: recombination mediator RecR [Candidatus Limnocylindrales bacterium]|nr:recombination mediator RecR [Candidatus Limnocylindrales bacterium]